MIVGFLRSQHAGIDEILSVRPSVKVATIEGEHFAMYANARAAAQAIAAFIPL